VDSETRAEIARILRESAERVEGRTATEREEAERRAEDFARCLRRDPTIIYSCDREQDS
jgi:hypothetical protein